MLCCPNTSGSYPNYNIYTCRDTVLYSKKAHFLTADRYVNANAEALRSNFVSHDGQKELVVYDEGNRYTTSYSRISDNFTKALEENINDPSLRDWVLQTFSTTTATDRTVAAVAMMGTLQKYFSYKAYLECGIPSVTLLGTREDWAKLRDAVADPKRLPEFGEETKVWSEVLGVVLNHFVESFDEPDSSEIKDFWQKIAHFSGGGSGPRYWSGWITAFCFWNEEGKYLRQSPIPIPNASMGGRMVLRRNAERHLNIDGQDFHKVDSSELPPARVSVPIIVKDNGAQFSGRMIAGCIGLNVTESGEELEQGGTGLDTLRPETGWWMFEEKET
jgi:hypothetical protein